MAAYVDIRNGIIRERENARRSLRSKAEHLKTIAEEILRKLDRRDYRVNELGEVQGVGPAFDRECALLVLYDRLAKQMGEEETEQPATSAGANEP